jgi:cytosine/uracil/thiamine/allantoin permease
VSYLKIFRTGIRKIRRIKAICVILLYAVMLIWVVNHTGDSLYMICVIDRREKRGAAWYYIGGVSQAAWGQRYYMHYATCCRRKKI